ncbi:exopolysaccharide biosynthesis polyprenyl glycosylphosphotransferase [Rhodopila sp.]|jgi:exopolysaccharide biosynthesis polyprenyl glycosylphosphotransferase|uniref:exopolysaccharide biosynthesis polyprenyl glycosylphosphotransferase n=1 Tax=Rhodopila sp. TaxID=2480087 RepID=UPI002CD6A3C2|nr:exopolysaccharide biosynthesis polyprenyl glycosylphosphotransferase [Rhodopila sp.]HVZ08608.1 exopolysaccharide biosynthesis polyprenyl glycosylphosphotransferase [Rhodopila sp.]
MGRAILHYLPRAKSALVLTECLLTFLLVYLLLALSAKGPQAPVALCNALAATFCFAIGATTLVPHGHSGEPVLSCRSLLITALAAGLLALPLVSAVSTVLGGPRYDLGTTLVVWAIWVGVLTSSRTVLGVLARHSAPVRRILLLGQPEQLAATGSRLSRLGRGRFEVVIGDTDQLSFDRLREQDITTVVVTGAAPVAALPTLIDCKLRGIAILNDLTAQERLLGRLEPGSLRAEDLAFGTGFADSRLGRVVKRGFDIAFALILLILALPLMVVTAIAIKADTPGPVFYRQQRVGQHGRLFTLCKFRSMTVDAEAAGPKWAQQADPRVTRVGRFIRASRIDELPQLVNVLLGHMSLVGPRPERPHFVEQLTAAIPFYHERSYVKPGVTGWAQVNYPYGASVEDAWEKLAYDLYYVKNRGILLDLYILIDTIRVVLFREGAR